MHTQDNFIEEANKWSNIFLTWLAWAGKTYILNQWKEQKELEWKTIITVAPTWIRAIQAWGATIHSTFKLYGDNYHVFKPQLINWNEIDILIIDEVSMVSCEMFEFMSDVIRRNTWTRKMFWWLQVICVWDLNQLPPIYNLNIKETKQRYDKLINELWWVYFNLSSAYKEWLFVEINLSESKRSSDNKLNDLLNRIRANDISALKEFKTEWYSSQFYNKATHIFPYNNQVDSFNYERLLKLPWKQFVFKWVIQGDFNMNNVLVPEELKLKVGATIMIIKNLENWLVNWDTGEILEIDSKDLSIKIRSDRLQQDYWIWLEKWENKVYDEHGSEQILWKLTHFPIKLWWRLTRHKTQGLTLDKVIFHYNQSLSKELVYVALSRWREYDNIYIIK